MKKLFFCCGVLPLLAGACWALRKPALPQAAGDLQKFVVVRSSRFVAPTETLTNADANCRILTASGAASMQCHPVTASQKSDYHYVAALIVDAKGTGYVIACRNSLIALWCKESKDRSVILGTMANANLAVADGDKVHNYAVLTSAYVGFAAAGLQPQDQAQAVAAQPPAAPAPPAAAATSSRPAAAPPAAVNRAANGNEAPAADASAACASASAAGACVSFVSVPPGADVYVDDKFVGNTPSTIALSAGSHEIRMEDANRKPWMRTLQTSAGSKITVRGTFDAPAADK